MLGMHLHFERSPNARCDCPLLSLTWMGKVPDEMPDEEGWKLNRTNYYQEGWLATGNVRGVVGVTFTSCHCKKIYDTPLRANYNLRGHRSEVALVKWNEPYQKLASCDSSGIIFVWIKYEGRWSIELINDRNTQVADFSWSHDGRMALICYQDDFVLVGSVAGQRYWSSMLNLEGTITCGIWTPDDQQVLFGTTDGQIIVMDVHGVMVAQVSVLDDVTITGMAWSCEKFKMEEGDEDDDDAASETSRSTRVLDKPAVLAVTFKNGLIYIMKNYDDVSPIIILTGLKGLKMEWTNTGDVLAVAGCTSNNNANDFNNVVQFYTDYGGLRYTTRIAYMQHPVSALTWGHNDKRLFVATGPFIHVGWVTRKVASLQLLSRLAIYHQLQNEEQIMQLLLPKRLKNLVVSLFSPTIKSCFPDSQLLREFVCRPPLGTIRYHCTMIRHDDDLNLSGGTCYTLYLEYLGGLVPLLKGKRSSKIRPEFIIYNPQVFDTPSSSDSSGDGSSLKAGNGCSPGNGHSPNVYSDLSDSEYEDGCASPRMQRRRKQMKKLLKEQMELELRLVDNLAYVDTLPEQERLVEVTSNIWGTKFKMHGVDPHLPANLGQITYKTSLLHLQPRQMTLSVTELREDLQLENDPSYNPNLFSEDEDDTQVLDDEIDCFAHLQKEGAPIAPMTPRKKITTTNGMRHRHLQHVLLPPVRPSTVLERVVKAPVDILGLALHASTETFISSNGEPDEFPYVDFANSPELLNLIERESQSYSRECNSSSGAAIELRKRTADEETNRCDRPDEDCSECSVSKAISSGSPIQRSVHKDIRLTSFVPYNGSASCVATPTLGVGHPSPWRLHSDIASPKRSPTTSSCLSSAFSANSSSTSNLGSASVRGEGQRVPRWAEKACDLKYIDEDEEGLLEWNVRSSLPQAHLLNRCRSHSVGHLNAMDIINSRDVTRVGSLREMKRRLILSQDRHPKSSHKPKMVQCGKSRSLDDSEAVSRDERSDVSTKETSSSTVPHALELQHAPHCHPPLDVIIHSSMSPPPSRLAIHRMPKRTVVASKESSFGDLDAPLHSKLASSLTHLASTSPSSSRPASPLLDRNILTSTPPTPKRSFSSHQRKNSLRRKSLLNSPLLSRRSRRSKVVESSDEEVTYSGDEMAHPNTFRDLESFQKAHIRQKLKKERLHHDNSVNSSPSHVQRREFVMHNKAPLWNENSQVYQLDFGGRVTQESAKNFQIEFRGKQVMQFGRIDGNAYTLDFQYPFTAIQAFAVALANVTQRLK